MTINVRVCTCWTYMQLWGLASGMEDEFMFLTLMGKHVVFSLVMRDL